MGKVKIRDLVDLAKTAIKAKADKNTIIRENQLAIKITIFEKRKYEN